MDAPPLMMAAIGLSIIALVMSGALQGNWRDVTETIRKPVLLLRAVVAVNLIPPVAALLVCLILPIDPVVKIGIIAMAVSPLAPPISSKLIGSGADASRIAGYFALLTMLSVVLVPPILAIASAALGIKLRVTAVAIAQTSLVLLLAPVALGLTINTLRPQFASRARKPLALAAYAVLGLITLILLASEWRAMASLAGDGSIAAMVAISLAAVAGGHLLGGPDPRARQMLATVASVRHPGIALMIVGANSAEGRAVTAVLLFLVVSLFVSGIHDRWAAGQASRNPAAAQI